jgi:hypothetical protein
VAAYQCKVHLADRGFSHFVDDFDGLSYMGVRGPVGRERRVCACRALKAVKTGGSAEHTQQSLPGCVGARELEELEGKRPLAIETMK